MLKRFWVSAAAIAATALLGTSPASAVLTGSAGGSTIFVQNRADNAPAVTGVVGFVDIPGANVVVTVPAGASRLVTARITGESLCIGAAAVAGRWCSVRVIVTNTVSGASQELNPVAGLDFAFDTVTNPNDLFESNAIERSIRLGPGTYRVRGQYGVSFNGVSFRLDDWHFRVDLNF